MSVSSVLSPSTQTPVQSVELPVTSSESPERLEVIRSFAENVFPEHRVPHQVAAILVGNLRERLSDHPLKSETLAKISEAYAGCLEKFSMEELRELVAFSKEETGGKFFQILPEMNYTVQSNVAVLVGELLPEILGDKESKSAETEAKQTSTVQLSVSNDSENARIEEFVRHHFLPSQLEGIIQFFQKEIASQSQEEACDLEAIRERIQTHPSVDKAAVSITAIFRKIFGCYGVSDQDFDGIESFSKTAAGAKFFEALPGIVSSELHQINSFSRQIADEITGSVQEDGEAANEG